jgi:hypothetical protein
MPNIRLIGANGKAVTSIANGRTYVCAAGATIDAPDFDAWILMANGFIALAAGVGATAQRPSKPSPGQNFHDTSLNLTIVWEGSAWRNPATGSVV